MTTRLGHLMLLGRRGRSRTRDGWSLTAPVWEREVAASRVLPEVSLAISMDTSLPKKMFFLLVSCFSCLCNSIGSNPTSKGQIGKRPVIRLVLQLCFVFNTRPLSVPTTLMLSTPLIYLLFFHVCA